MTQERLPFCGRERELEVLKKAWGEVKSGIGPRPRIVAVLAESGFGKTRLVQEFYGWLSRSEDKPGDEGYWPDDITQEEANLIINPPISACLTANVLPFLWWGIRFDDPGERNAAVGDALPAAIAHLDAHLDSWKERAKKDAATKELLKIWGGAAFETALDFVPGAGLVKNVVGAFKETVELTNATRRPDPSIAKIAEDTLSLFFKIQARQGAERPVVLLIDDAQFSSNQEGTQQLLAALLPAAYKKNWPLLVILTSWVREWVLHRAQSAPSVASVIDRLIGEGKCSPDALQELRLAPLIDLTSALRHEFGGLSLQQTKLFLERAGGNPRLLSEMILHFRDNPMFFNDNDTTAAMNEDGEAELANERFDLDVLIQKRLTNAPPYVRWGIGLSSLQAARFLKDITVDVARRLNVDGDIQRGLEEAEKVHHAIQSLSGVLAEFVQRPYWQASQRVLGNLVQRKKVDAALLEVIREYAAANLDPDSEKGRLFAIVAADVLGESALAADRLAAVRLHVQAAESAQRQSLFRSVLHHAGLAIQIAEDLERGQDVELSNTATYEAARASLVYGEACRARGELSEAGLAFTNSHVRFQRLSQVGDESERWRYLEKDISAIMGHADIEMARGRLTEAEDHIDQAIRIWESALAAPLYRAKPEHLLRLATLQGEKGHVLNRKGQILNRKRYLQDAEQILRGALTRAERALEDIGSCSTPIHYDSLSLILHYLGHVLIDQWKLDDSIAISLRATRVKEKLILALGDNVTLKHKSELAVLEGNLASLLCANEDLEEAETIIVRALNTTQQILAILGSDATPDYRRGFAVQTVAWAFILEKRGKGTEAESVYAAAIRKEEEALAASDKRNAAHDYFVLATVLEGQASMFRERGYFSREAEASSKAVNYMDQSLALLGYEASLEHYKAASTIFANEAHLLSKLGKLSAAVAAYEKAAGLQEKMTVAVSEVVKGEQEKKFISLVGFWARTLRRQGNLAGAEAIYDQAVRLTQELLSGMGDVSNFYQQDMLASLICGKACVHRARGDLDRARATYDEAIAIHRQIRASLKANVTRDAKMATSLELKAVLLADLGDFSGALNLIEHSIAAQGDPTSSKFASRARMLAFAETLQRRADVHRRLGNLHKATADVDAAVVIVTNYLPPVAAEATPGVLDLWAILHRIRGQVLALSGEASAALVAYRDALKCYDDVFASCCAERQPEYLANCAETADAMAQALESTGDPAGATEARGRADALRTERLSLLVI